MKLTALILLVALLGVGGVAVVSASEKPEPRLAEKINGACTDGFRVQDWIAADYLGYLPAGVVQVTCASEKTDATGVPVKTYKVAVER